MRTINEIIVHCSATPEYVSISVDTIRGWHRAQGWSDVGYHYIVHETGTIEKGRPVRFVGAHCLGHNSESIGICYIGGIDADGTGKDTRTDAQKAALRELIAKLCIKYKIKKISGHRDYNRLKECPCFDASSEYSDLI